MGFFDFVKGKNSVQDWKKTLVKDLIMLTAVDGEMDKDEIKLVLNIAVNELDFSEKEFVAMMNNLGDIRDIYPKDMKDKQAYLIALIRMTFEDGYVDDNEVQYMKIIAKRMNLSESFIDKAINNIEQSCKNDEAAYHDDSSIGKTIITSSFNPTADVQSEKEVVKYLEKISKISRLDLCIELSNVMSAKHNLTAMPSGIGTFSNTQKLVTDLTDKALIICIYRFGRENILEYIDGDISEFNQLVNDIDAKVARLDLAPAQHGNKMFEEIEKVLGI